VDFKPKKKRSGVVVDKNETAVKKFGHPAGMTKDKLKNVKLSLVRTWFANVPLPVCDHSHGIYLDPNTGDRVKFFGFYSNEQTSKLTEKISTECTRWA